MICDPKGLQALDKHVGANAYVAFLGPRFDNRSTLLLSLDKGNVKVMGTIGGLCGDMDK